MQILTLIAVEVATIEHFLTNHASRFPSYELMSLEADIAPELM